jgi:DNA-binding response OmpR family regulator
MKKILVVDDDPDILEVVNTILTTNGFSVITNSTGFNVPEIVSYYHPDLVLLDVRLPGKPGTEICKDLKLTSSHPPVILFSAHATMEESYGACHADAFIKKPFSIDNLIGTIKLHVA